MKLFIRFLCITLILSNISFAGDTVKWAKGDIVSSDLDINNFRFTNRARCALDSKTPTESAFILIQNMEVAKGLYRLAKATDNNSTDLTKMGISVYRYSIIQLLQLIHQKLVSGELPLLPVDTSDKNAPPKYAAISAKCKSDSYCTELDVYMSSIWKAVDSKTVSKVDRFQFIDKKIFNNKNLTCHYLKKFSPLQASLYGTKPNGKVFEEIAKAGFNKDEYFAECNDLDAQTDLKVASYQIELPELNGDFTNLGFDYWNSLKLYLSWAFRNAPEYQKMAAPFGEVLKGVALEESVMIIPNGCKSITPAKCGGDYLQLNTLRDFAKEDFKKTALTTDVLSPFPDGPQDGMIDDPTPAVNNDIADLSKFENAEKWMENLRDNLASTRGVMKRKLINSINFLNLVTPRITPEKMIELVGKAFAKIGVDESTNEFVLNSGISKEEELSLKNELYYLCSEFTQAGHEDFSFIKGDLEILKKTSLIDQVAGSISEQSTAAAYGFYEKLSSMVVKKCNSINQKNLWDGDFVLDKSGFSKWYLVKIYEGKINSTQNEKYKSYLANNTALISYKAKTDSGILDSVICANGVDCARKTLEAIIDLYAVAEYANTFWSMDQMVKTPAMLNPYAERTVCKVYDPWFKTKQIITNLITSMGQAAMSAFVPGAGILASLDLQPGKVTSMKQLINEGKIQYDIKKTPNSIFRGLLLDFGPLVGVPCKVSITRGFDNPFAMLNFSGITVGGCSTKDNSVLDVYSASEIGDPHGARANACASCTLNFESVVHSATAIGNIAPYVGPGLFLLDGLVRLVKSIQNSPDVPKNWKTNPNYVMDTYRRFGEIPKGCNFKLRNGKQCLKNRKEEKIQSIVRTNLKTTNVVSMKYRPLSPNAEVMVTECSEPIKVLLRIRGGRVTLPESCKHLSKEATFENIIQDPWDEDKSTFEDDIAGISPNKEALDIESAYFETERATTARAETVKVEAAKIEAAKIEAAKIEAAKIEAAKIEAAKVEAAKVEAARIAAEASALKNRITITDLNTNDCLITKKDTGINSLLIMKMKVTGIKEFSEDKAKWFIKNPTGKDIPLYNSNNTSGVMFVNNVTLRLNNPLPKEIEIYSKENSTRKVSIETCKGFSNTIAKQIGGWK